MNRIKSKKCPKCDGEMEEGDRLTAFMTVVLKKKKGFFGDTIIPFYCKRCGFIELYRK